MPPHFLQWIATHDAAKAALSSGDSAPSDGVPLQAEKIAEETTRPPRAGMFAALKRHAEDAGITVSTPLPEYDTKGFTKEVIPNVVVVGLMKRVEAESAEPEVPKPAPEKPVVYERVDPMSPYDHDSRWQQRVTVDVFDERHSVIVKYVRT